ncbi:MAG: sulfatase-like hydrolase/transferase [Myxococcales bacterium]|nr:sulfatase-like hydrolase/transferase [Myxococcales bacterium]
MWILTTLACGLFGPDAAFLDAPPADPISAPEPLASTALALGRDVPAAVLELPPSSRPSGRPAPAIIGLRGPFERHDSKADTDIWRVPMPVHRSLLPAEAGGTHVLGNFPPPGLLVLGPDPSTGPLPFSRRARREGSWGFDEDYLFIGVPVGSPAPKAKQYKVRFPKATNTENGLNFAHADTDAATFAHRTMVVGESSHAGLFLPAPATAAFDVTVPERGRLAFEALILPSSIVTARTSDGARVVVSVEHEGTVTQLGSVSATPGGPTVGRFDLARWENQTIRLVLTTEPGDNPLFDYVLLEGPTVYTPKDRPTRVVLLFADTLRPDHLGFMGYERETSPVLDRWSTHASVFTEARSVAPWTLPSARALLTGVQPERYYEVPTLPEQLGDAGFRTEALVANAFLSHPFDLHLGWDRYTYLHRLDAPSLVRRAQDILEAHGDRDVLLMVHFMEPHLPYEGDDDFDGLFTGDMPRELGPLTRSEILRWYEGVPGFEDVKAYVVGRYDQNIRAMDTALLPLLHAAGNDATVVLLSDHGEEFWEHGSFEHGHTFHDEVMRVALSIRSPRLPAGVHDAPVSLLDVTPTVLDVVGLPTPEGAGRSLVDLSWGKTGAAEALAARPQAFGRPLYGEDGWGVLTEDRKWWDRDGSQQLFAVKTDPLELKNRAASDPDLASYPERLSEALGRPVRRVWRVSLRAAPLADPVQVTLSHPDGIDAAWLGYLPRGRRHQAAPELVDGRVQLDVPARTPPPSLLYLLPTGSALEPKGLAITFVGRKLHAGNAVTIDEPLVDRPAATIFLRAGDPRISAHVDLAWVPEPDGVEVPGFHPDLQQQLRELGYVDE